MHKPQQVYLVKSEPALTILKEWIEKNFQGGPILLIQILNNLWAVACQNGKLIDGVQVRRIGHSFRFEETK